MNNDMAKLLAAVKEALTKGSPELAKAFSQAANATTGLTAYDLEGPAKLLYPVITPLRNSMPRVSGKGGIQANWRAITGINVNALSGGVSEGNRGGVITTSTADYVAAYRGLGFEDYVTFEADYAGEGFDDIKARAVQGLLRALMIYEEKVILSGDNSFALNSGNATPTPTLTLVAGGALPSQTNSVICVALTAHGLLNSSVAGGITAAISRTNADASSDSYGGGAGKKSAAATQATSGGNLSVSGHVTAVSGACGYAWFWGVGGSEALGAITTINSVLITAAATGTQTAASLGTADNSKNALTFDGLMYQAFTSGSNAYLATMATGVDGTGTGLTAGTDGSITEFDVALQSFWDNYRLSPDEIIVGSQEMKNIRKKVLTGATAAAQRFVFTTDQHGVTAGSQVKSYLNPFTMAGPAEIPISLHPNMPNGTVLFLTHQLPYPLSNVANVMQIRTRRDYYQLEWPLRSRKYEYGIYADEVLQHYAPFSMGIISNIGNA